MKLSFSRKSIYIIGNYNKYSRFLSQTPWEVDGKKLYESSVYEIISKYIVHQFKVPSN